MELLETVLHRVPGNTVALERLLDLYLGAGNDRRTAELASELEQIHKARGDSAATDRFAELRRRFERAAPVEPQAAAAPTVAAAPPEFSVPVVDAEPVPEPAAGTVGVGAEETGDDLAASSVHEVDLSEEWAALAGQVETPAFPGDASQDGARAEASHAVELTPSASQKVQEAREPEPEYVLELDANAGAMAGDGEAANSILSALSAEFDAAVSSLVGAPPEQAMPPPPATSAKAQDPNGHAEAPVAAKQPSGPLGDVFDQFRADLGETAVPGGEDLETHYNLGIAYREMGLLEEAISEFQKVAKANNKNGAFRYAMQCCTLLGLAFMERGQPSIAAMWYERALETPGLDQETILALRYDLGVAQELAGDTSAARKSFSQVYGVNIDYRDVGERLAALGKER